MILALGDGMELDQTLFELRRAGAVVPMEPQAFDVLSYLVAHRDRIVTKEELMDAVWGGRFVSESAVTSRIKQARRALGDDGQAQRFIRTQHGRGYRYVGSADRPPASDDVRADGPTVHAPVQAPVRHTLSDGLHIAYQVTGASRDGGPLASAPDIVLISGFVSHLELDWDDPRHARFLDGLGEMGRLIRFDKRGTGMSDRPEGIPDLETRMHDVLSVMDSVGSRQAVVCGYSEGGPMALLLAATHPERVSRLVLYGSYAKRSWAEDYPWAQTIEQRREYTQRLVEGWDWEADLAMRNPTSDAAMRRWWGLRMRASATPATVQAVMQMNDLIDVRDVLPAIKVPTLVLHRREDALFDVEEAVYLADRIPGARLQVLDGADHFVAGDPDQILNAIRPFVAANAVPADPQETVLAAVVAVDPPARAASQPAVDALRRAGGRVRSTPDDRYVVLFDGPATAVRAAHAATLDGQASAAVIVAEVPARDETVPEVVTAAAAALARDAPAGQVYASPVAAMLMSATGLRLTEAAVGADSPAFVVHR
jgi:pimeloyl-ACP methyl ester carboxylesterase